MEVIEQKQTAYELELQEANRKLNKYSSNVHGLLQKEKGINERVEILEDETSIEKTTIHGLKKKNAAYEKEIERLRDIV